MARGERIYNIIGAGNSKEKPKESARKGRSAKKIESRNERLFYRYFYYSRIINYNYQSALSLLSEEFDIAEITLTEIISNNAARVKEISIEAPTRNKLRGMYPHLNWSEKSMAVVVNKKRGL